MEQQFACPHCSQILASPPFATTQQVQCPHCGGLFAVAASTAAEPTAISQSGAAAYGQRPANASNLKFLVAGAVMLATAAVPLLGYGLMRLFAAPQKPVAVAAADAAQPRASQQPAEVVLTGRFIKNDAAASNRPAFGARDENGPQSRQASSGPARTPVAPTPPTALPPSKGAPVSRPSPSTGRTATASAEVAQAAPADTAALVQRIEPSVMVIQVTRDKSSGIGSGFPLDNQGTIVTNYHVIEGATSVTVKYGDKTADAQGFLVFSPGKDIAILKANLGAARVAPLKLAVDKPVKGETVLTFGAPLGFDSTVSNGIVSSVRKGSDLREIFKRTFGSDVYIEEQHYDLDAVWVQTTAPISGGNSGGPLVNLRGEVVGLNTWHLVAGQNMNFAISAEHINDMMKSAQSGVHPFSELPPPREHAVAAGSGKRTLEYWEEVSRINRGLATRLKSLRQPPIPNTKQQLIAMFPKLAGIYKKLGDLLPETAGKLKGLKIDDVDAELVALVTVDAIVLEKIGEDARDMSADAKRMRADKLAIYDYEKLSKKSYGEFDKLELGQAYDVIRIKLTRRYGLTFANIFEAPKGKSAAKSGDDDKSDTDQKAETADGGDPQREKQAAGKLRLAKQLQQAGKHDAAKQRLQQIMDDYPGTKAAEEAQTLLEEFGE